MDNIKLLLINSINPDSSIRLHSEHRLLSLSKDPPTILSLPSLFTDPDTSIRKLSAIFFKNSLISNWSTELYLPFHVPITTNILYILSVCDKYSVEDIKIVLSFILETLPVEDWSILLKNASGYLKDPGTSHVGLTFYEIVCKEEKVKYNGDTVDHLFLHVYGDLSNLLLHFLGKGEYGLAKKVVKIFVFLGSGVISFAPLDDYNNFVYFYNIFCEVLKISNVDRNTESFELLCNLKKWVVKYFIEKLNKSLRDLHRNKEIGNMFLDEKTLVYLYDIVINCVKYEMGFIAKENGVCVGSKSMDSYLKNCVSFINIIVSDSKKHSKMIMKDIGYLVFDLILNLQMFSEQDEELFEDNYKKYIRERYNYYALDFRSYSAILYNDIMKMLKKEESIRNEIEKELGKILVSYNENPTKSNARKKFAAVFLISSAKTNRDYKDFIVTFILPDLNSEYEFLRSQALYSLQHFDGSNLDENNIKVAFELVINNMKSDNLVLKIDSLLSITFFYNNNFILQYFQNMIPFIIQNLLEMQKDNELEIINDALESLINTFPGSVQEFAPKLVTHIVGMMLPFITSKDNDKINIHQGYLKTLSELLSSLFHEKNLNNENNLNNEMSIINNIKKEKRDLCYGIYCTLYEVFNSIFLYQIDDLYSEGLILLGECIYALGFIDESMWNMFAVISGWSNDDKSCYSDDVHFVLDNYISFGRKEDIIKHVELFMTFLEALCKPEDSHFYEEDHVIGIKIMICLLHHLNINVSNYIEKFIDYSMYLYDAFDREGHVMVYYLELIMNCFIIDFWETYRVLIDKHKVEIFLNDLYEFRSMFTRVIDKKTIIIFIGMIMRNQNNMENNQMLNIKTDDIIKINCDAIIRNIINNISRKDIGMMLNNSKAVNVKRLNKILIENIESFNIAMDKRNKLLNSDETSDEEENDVLEEDISYESPIDEFNAKIFMKDCLAMLNQLGERMIRLMDEDQKNKLKQFIQ